MKKTLLGVTLCSIVALQTSALSKQELKKFPPSAKITSTNSLQIAKMIHTKYVRKAKKNGTLNPVPTWKELLAEQQKTHQRKLGSKPRATQIHLDTYEVDATRQQARKKSEKEERERRLEEMLRREAQAWRSRSSYIR